MSRENTTFDESKYEILKEHRFPDPWENADGGVLVRVFRYAGGKPKVSVLRYFKGDDGNERVVNKGSIPTPNIGKVGDALRKIQNTIDANTNP